MSYPKLQLFIDGEWIDAVTRKTLEVVDPATEETSGELPAADKADMGQALAAPETGSACRVQSAVLRRAAGILRDRRNKVAALATREEGKSIGEARLEVGAAAETLEWFAEEGRRAHGRVIPGRLDGWNVTLIKEPVGPVLAPALWNFPVVNPAFLRRRRS